MVYVINYDNQPLMPCNNTIARLLLKQGKAKVKRKTPFTIKLTYQVDKYTQDLTLGVDTGSSKIGSAVVKDNGDVIYLSEVEIRNDITDKMKQRSKYRRNRRNRKTRYRKARWLNRKNSIKNDRFSPTMISKINSHIKEIEHIKSILPITTLVLETGQFDTHLMKNPSLANENIRHWGYQKGINYGFENTKAMVLNRDRYKCQYCKGKSKDSKLEVHHIIFRRNGGSDYESNLITLCHTCHKDLHSGKINPKFDGKKKGTLKHATQMNSIRVQLLKIFQDAEETFGFITKEHRQLMELNKEHYNDAIAIANLNNIKKTGLLTINFKVNTIILKKCISDGDYQYTKGIRSEQKIPTGKIKGFRKFDKIKYFGKEYFIKGRMSTGYAILMDISGNKIDFSNNPKGRKTPKMEDMIRIASRKSWIVDIKNVVNSSHD